MTNTMSYKGYVGSVDFSADDNCLFGKVLGLRSLISYEAESVAELRREFESCWALLKRHLCRFCGGWRHNLDLWLREVEMRWECGGARFFAELDRLFA